MKENNVIIDMGHDHLMNRWWVAFEWYDCIVTVILDDDCVYEMLYEYTLVDWLTTITNNEYSIVSKIMEGCTLIKKSGDKI